MRENLTLERVRDIAYLLRNMYNRNYNVSKDKTSNNSYIYNVWYDGEIVFTGKVNGLREVYSF